MYIYIDINECVKDVNSCSKLKNSYCINYNSSYGCKCNTGYEKINHTCEGYNITQYLYYIVIVIVIFIWWSLFIPSRNLDEVFTYNHIWL